jgi:hypothetical protein
VLRYVLAVGPHAASGRFEVFAEAEPIRLADGTPGGRRFRLAEVIDLGRPGEADRLRRELEVLVPARGDTVPPGGTPDPGDPEPPALPPPATPHPPPTSPFPLHHSPFTVPPSPSPSTAGKPTVADGRP